MKNLLKGKLFKKEEAAFAYLSHGHDLHVELAKGGKKIPITEWASHKPEAAKAVEDLLTNERATIANDNSLVLTPDSVASLDAASALAIGLPPPTNLALDLKPVETIDKDDFRLNLRWVKPGGQPVFTSIEGAILTNNGVAKRIPEPLWSIYKTATALSSPIDKAERFRLLAKLKKHWPHSGDLSVSAEPYLHEMRVHYASTLSLSLKTLTPDNTVFDPVLFGLGASENAELEDRAIDETLDNVLTPSSQKLFAEDRFRREPEARPVYVLRDGEYIFIDPSLRPALNAVRKLQDRPESIRRAFVLNPRTTLKELLGPEEAERIALDELFVETEQFSSRVAGVDIWRAKILPWIVPTAQNKWLPERFGIRVGEDYYEIPASNVSTVIERVIQASESGSDIADVSNLLLPAKKDAPPPPAQLPVNDQVIETLRSLEPFARGLEEAAAKWDDDHAEAPEGWDAATQGKLFLVVHENFEEVEFAPFNTDKPLPPPTPATIPSRLTSTLKAHQVEGLNWLVRSIETGHPGALLADDMGLGKTLQAITFMAWLQEEAEAGRRPQEPFLIVAPTGLLGTWRSEISKHLKDKMLGKLVPAFGSDLKHLKEEDCFAAPDIETGKAALKAESWRDGGVVLTTYETLRDYHFSFARTRFGLVVYDEIQKLKNPVSQMTRAAKTLNSAFTLGMTGTPVENRLQDLWSIMDVIAPGLLGASRDFEKRHPATDGVALAKLKSQLTEAPENHAPYMMRRLKSDALKDMPQKLVHLFEGTMPPEQAHAYRNVVIQAAAASASGSVGKGGMLNTLARLRGISLHPHDPASVATDLDSYAAQSARLSRTLELLTGIAAKNEKALIFVEDLNMQAQLARMIQDRFALKRKPMCINGTVAGMKRQQMVEVFQSEPNRFDVMILSPKAGGVGLTLTEANHVIHLSRWWNPAVEDQATDRVYRIGQRRDVHVYLPMAVHPDEAIKDSSFDLRLNALIDRKRQLTRDLFLPPESSEGELSDLFREVSLGEAPTKPDVTSSAVQQKETDTHAQETPAGTSSPRAVAETVSSAEAPARRPILSLPKTLENTGFKHWRVQHGDTRPTEEIVALFKGKDIVEVKIQDPYALGTQTSRNAQIRFIADLQKVARKVESFSIEYAEDIAGDGQESASRSHIGHLSTRLLSPIPKFDLIRRRKRSYDDDFHDRLIDIYVRHAGGAIRMHSLNLGRGLEALYEAHRQCTVTYVPPQDAAERKVSG